MEEIGWILWYYSFKSFWRYMLKEEHAEFAYLDWKGWVSRIAKVRSWWLLALRGKFMFWLKSYNYRIASASCRTEAGCSVKWNTGAGYDGATQEQQNKTSEVSGGWLLCCREQACLLACCLYCLQRTWTSDIMESLQVFKALRLLYLCWFFFFLFF